MNWPETPNGSPLGDGRFASAVEQPTDRDTLAELVLQRVSEAMAIYPQGGRTALEFGGLPERPGIALDLTRLNRVIDYPAADMTITVEAGMTLAVLQQTLAKEGQRLPLEAPFADRATIGGIYSTDTSGPRRYGLGRPRDQIIGVAFVTSEGTLVKGGGRVVKNVAGYDLPKLLTGSNGSLGTIVELTLKTRPRPEATAIFWTRWDQIEQLDSVLTALNTSRTRPIALELLNAPAAKAVAQDVGLDLASSGPVLAVGLEGASEVVDWQLKILKEELANATEQESVRNSEADRLWTSLSSHLAADVPISFKASLVPSAVLGFIAAIDPGRWDVQSHAGNGLVWGLARSDGPIEELVAEILTFREKVIAADGTMILPRCPTHQKSNLGVWGVPRADWELARMIKRALDPAGAMNPGRFL